MKRLFVTCLLGALAMPAYAMQQTPPPPAQPAQAQQPPQGRGGRGAATPAPTPPTAEGQPGGRGAGGRGPSMRYDAASLQNVRVEVTLTDTLPADGPSKKSVSMIVVDGNIGAIRSQGPTSGVQLNVDAEPHVRQDGKIYLSLSIFYSPDSSNSAGSTRPLGATLNETLSVIVADGKPMVVSQSADPRGDRKVTVEVMATVVK